MAAAMDGGGQNMTIAAPPKDALDELLEDFTEFVQTELVKQEDKKNTGELNIIAFGAWKMFDNWRTLFNQS